MNTVKIATSDQIIWDQSNVCAEIIHAMSVGKALTLDFLCEGPDLRDIGIYDFIEKWADRLGYLLSDITIITANAVEQHDVINIVYAPPLHLVDNAKEYNSEITKNHNLKHFGLFVGRSTPERLQLATHLHKKYQHLTSMSYHFDVDSEFHCGNIGLDAVVKNYRRQDVIDEAKFLSCCPITLDDQPAVDIDKTLRLNPAQQLLKQDQHSFLKNYQHFFVEIVAESYCRGNTFFPTEKIFRPILLKTPFVVQGPRYFLHRMRDLGFKTFASWWDEGYSEDPHDWQLTEITRVVDFLAQYSTEQLHKITHEMAATLNHNRQHLLQLTKKDFEALRSTLVT